MMVIKWTSSILAKVENAEKQTSLATNIGMLWHQ